MKQKNPFNSTSEPIVKYKNDTHSTDVWDVGEIHSVRLLLVKPLLCYLKGSVNNTLIVTETEAWLPGATWLLINKFRDDRAESRARD